MITIAIPVYNRLDFLNIMAKSLSNIDMPLPCNIRIYDDKSTDFDISDLKKLFPNAASINRNKVNFKADKNMYFFYKDFLSTQDEYLFNADSDIIFNKNCLTQALDFLKQTDGVLSLFNATSHPVKEVYNNDLCIKETIGAAGTFFIRKRVKEIIDSFSGLEDKNQIKSFDWKWSNYLINNNIRIFCTNNSLIQHIGYYGQNTLIPYRGYRSIKIQKPYYDYGRNFKIDSIETGQIINDIFEKLVDQNRMEDEKVIRLLSKKITFKIINLFKLIKIKLLKI